MTKKKYIVKVTPLQPVASHFVDVNTINSGSAEFIALQVLKERGLDINYFTTKVTEIPG